MTYLSRLIQKNGGISFLGYWNAATNTPTLTSGSGERGYWIVSASGNTDLNGETDWVEKDWAVFDGLAYRKIDNTDRTDQIIGIETDNFSLGYNLDQTLATVTFYSSPSLTLASRIALVTFEYNAANYPTKETWTYYGSNGTSVTSTVIYQNSWTNGVLTQRVKA